MLAQLIPGAKLVVIPGGGHRVLWEAVEECTDLIDRFLASIRNHPLGAASDPRDHEDGSATPHALVSAAELLTALPLALARAAHESLIVARQSMLLGSSRFGDGKPIIILAPPFIGSDLVLLPFSMWLKALGYRPVTVGESMSLDDSSADRYLAQAVDDITRRVRRKAVLITHSSGIPTALRTAAVHRDTISDVVVFDALHPPHTDGLRVHFVSSGWPLLHGMVELPRLLRSIGIELIEATKQDGLTSFDGPTSVDGEN
jgi:pimeloyl-ACP methyl ester carboxylesterase